jgi:hypothetical protein
VDSRNESDEARAQKAAEVSQVQRDLEAVVAGRLIGELRATTLARVNARDD